MPLPDLAALKDLARRTSELANLYRQGGDGESAQAALQIALGMGQRLSEPGGEKCLMHEVVGLNIQRQILEGMDPAGAYDDSHTVRERLDRIAQQQEELKRLHDPALGMTGGLRQEVLQSLSEQDLIAYFDRMKVFGEREALQWAMARQGRR